MASSPLDPRHVAPPPPETRRPCRLQRFLKDWEVGNELLILGVIALCVGLSLVATSGPITRSIWFPAMLAGAAIILVRVAVASLRSWPWARGLGIAGLALFALDLGGCTIRPGILLPLWAPFLGIALLGVFVPRLARMLAESRSPRFNAVVMFAVTLLGLLGMTQVIPWVGILPVVLLFCVMSMMNLFVSQYLNQVTESHQRATVLSFKGLSYNVGYGAVGLLYSLLIAVLEGRAGELSAAAGQGDAAFVQSLTWFPVYFCGGGAAVAWFARKRLKDS